MALALAISPCPWGSGSAAAALAGPVLAVVSAIQTIPSPGDLRGAIHACRWWVGLGGKAANRRPPLYALLPPGGGGSSPVHPGAAGAEGGGDALGSNRRQRLWRVEVPLPCRC